MAWCLGYIGDFVEASARGEEALRLAEAAQHDLSLAMAYAGVARPYLVRGDFPQAVSWLGRSMEICRRASFAPLFLLVAGDLGQAYALSGRVEEGLALLQEATAQSGALNLLPTHAWNVTMLAEVCAHLGDARRAATLYELLLPFERRNVVTAQCVFDGPASRYLGIMAATRPNSLSAFPHT